MFGSKLKPKRDEEQHHIRSSSSTKSVAESHITEENLYNKEDVP